MTVDELQVLITANTDTLREELNKANKNIANLQKSANKSQTTVTTAFKKLKQGIVALGIGKVIKDSIQLGMDAIESETMFDTVFGDSADAVRSWSEELSNALGLNAVAVRNNTGVIYSMTKSMGVAQENALTMSKGIASLSEDLASFRNLQPEEAFNKLRAGLTGETEPLKAIGILVDENTIKQVAYSEGIANVGSELSQQQKVLARYVAIMKQTGYAQGDLARTITSPANQVRLLKNNITQLGTSLGEFLMPVLNAVLPYLNAFTKVIGSAISGLSGLLGIGGTSASEETEKIKTNTEGIGTGLNTAQKNAKKLKSALAGFDEMNVLQDNTADTGASSGGGGTVSTGINFKLDEYDAQLGLVKDRTSAIAEKIKSIFSTSFGSIDLTNITTALGTLKEALAPFVDNVASGLEWLWNNVLIPLAAWTIEDVLPAFLNLIGDALGFVNQMITDLQPIFTWFWDNVLSPIAEWTGGVIVSVLNGMGDALQWITNNKIAMDIIEGIALAIGLVAAAIGIYNVVMAVCNIVTGLFGSIMAVITSPITLVVAAIAAVIAIVLICIDYWEEIKAVAVNVWNGIKSVWNSVATWFMNNVVTPVVNVFTGLWNGLKNGAKSAWNGIKSVFSAVATFFKNIFSAAWDGIVSVFSVAGEIFVNIKDGIITAFKFVVNGIIKGINTVVGLPFKGLNAVLDTISGISILGVEPFGWLTWRCPVPQIPQLAKGGIVSAPTYAMVGEAGTEAVMPLERNTGWIDKLALSIAEKMGGNNGAVNLTVKLGEDTIFERFIDYAKDRSFETNGEVVFAL